MRLAARTSHYIAGWEAIYPNLTSGSAFARSSPAVRRAGPFHHVMRIFYVQQRIIVQSNS